METRMSTNRPERGHKGTDKARVCMPNAGSATAVRDPVCGMEVDPHATAHRATYDGRAHYFCSSGCRDKFLAAPSTYVTRVSGPSKSEPEGTIYTCPMHPQIRQVGPGFCPICGMALEPELASAEEGPNAELLDMTRRFWIGLALTVPVFALEMAGHFTDLHALIGS